MNIRSSNFAVKLITKKIKVKVLLLNYVFYRHS